MRQLGRFVMWTLAGVGLLALSLLGLGTWAAFHLSPRTEYDLPGRMVLSLDLDAGFRTGSEGNPLAIVSGEKSYELRHVVETLEAAATDRHVTGLFATLGHAGLGLAEAQELRDAVARFRASGKPAVLFAETMGEGGGGTQDAYLASAFGDVWLQPSGEVGLTGILAESPFIRGTLDLLGVKPQFSGRHEYKSAIEMFTETGFSAPHKENLGRLLDSLSEQLAAGIAQGRRLKPETVADLIGKGPFLPEEAKAAGLVDHLGYRDQAWQAVAQGKDGEAEAEEVDLADYAAHLAAPTGAKVALIQGLGGIHRGESRSGLGGGADFGAATVAQAFRDAVEDEDIKAILFRVDSPGGSYTASDTVWNEVRRARAAGKPVVVSMGNVAASGGYFVSMAADRIVAEPGTVTGSIGVFTGKLVLEDFWKKLGIHWDELHRGDNAAIWSANQPFTPEAQARIDALLDRIYADFTGKAEEGRKITPEAMDKLARGRIWTGADAKANGLVDELGGWETAKAAVRRLARLEPDAKLELVDYPRPKRLWEVAAEALSSGEVRQLESLARAVSVLEPALRPLAEMGRNGGAELRLAPGLPGERRP